MLEVADAQGKPCYLETAAAANRPWEAFLMTGESTVYGSDAPRPESGSKCCEPNSSRAQEGEAACCAPSSKADEWSAICCR